MKEKETLANRSGAGPQTFWLEAWSAWQGAWLGMWGIRPPASPRPAVSPEENPARTTARRFRGCVGPADLAAMKEEDGKP